MIKTNVTLDKRVVFPTIVGNESLIKRIASDVVSNKLLHGYVIEGEAGSGKKTLAVAMAAAVNCKNRYDSSLPLPCGECDSCRKINSFGAVDIKYIDKEDKASISVLQIRDVKQDIYFSPQELDTKVYIVDDADKLTVQAQNAFLVALEEPPKNILFLLLVEKSENLLETIKSRIPIIRTEKLNSDLIYDYLQNNSKAAAELSKKNNEEYRSLVLSAAGSIGKALDLLDNKNRKNILAVRKVATSLVYYSKNESTTKELISAILALPQKRDELIEIYTAAQQLIRDLLVIKKSSKISTCFILDSSDIIYNEESAKDVARYFSVASLEKKYQAFETAKTSLYSNANVNITNANLSIKLST